MILYLCDRQYAQPERKWHIVGGGCIGQLHRNEGRGTYHAVDIRAVSMKGQGVKLREFRLRTKRAML